jgi:hypothetical protein
MCLIRAFTALSRYLASQRTDRGFITRKYLLGEYSEYDETMTHVPEDCMYVEEWRKGDELRRRIIYELEEITPFVGNAFDPVKAPWTWIGDLSTEVDVTDAVDRYLMPGNEIRLDLLLMFLKAHEDMSIQYLDPASGELCLFPNEGVRIEADGSA